MDKKTLLKNLVLVIIGSCSLVGCQRTQENSTVQPVAKELTVKNISTANSGEDLMIFFDEVEGAKEYQVKLEDSYGKAWNENQKYTLGVPMDITELPPGNYLPFVKAIAKENYKDSKWTPSNVSFIVANAMPTYYYFEYDEDEMTLFSSFYADIEISEIILQFGWNEGTGFKTKEKKILNNEEIDVSDLLFGLNYTLSVKILSENVMRSMNEFVEVSALNIPMPRKQETPENFIFHSDNRTIEFVDEQQRENELVFFDMTGAKKYSFKNVENEQEININNVDDGKYRLGFKFLGNGKGITDSDFAYAEENIVVGKSGLLERNFEITRIFDSYTEIKVFLEYDDTITKYNVRILKDGRQFYSGTGNQKTLIISTDLIKNGNDNMSSGNYEIIFSVNKIDTFVSVSKRQTFSHTAPQTPVTKITRYYSQVIEINRRQWFLYNGNSRMDWKAQENARSKFLDRNSKSKAIDSIYVTVEALKSSNLTTQKAIMDPGIRYIKELTKPTFGIETTDDLKTVTIPFNAEEKTGNIYKNFSEVQIPSRSEFTINYRGATRKLEEVMEDTKARETFDAEYPITLAYGEYNPASKELYPHYRGNFVDGYTVTDYYVLNSKNEIRESIYSDEFGTRYEKDGETTLYDFTYATSLGFLGSYWSGGAPWEGDFCWEYWMQDREGGKTNVDATYLKAMPTIQSITIQHIKEISFERS